jgi:hypothetical protein
VVNQPAGKEAHERDQQPDQQPDQPREQEHLDEALRTLFAAEGLLRYLALGDETGEVVDAERGPLILLGPSDADAVLPPNPDELGYPGRKLRSMTLDQYNIFLYRWFEAAVGAGDVRCAYCGELIRDADDLSDAETWDAIFVEKELVAWMVLHFDCKRWISKKLKGMHPFELPSRLAPHYDLSTLDPALTERPVQSDDDEDTPDAQESQDAPEAD